jgi:hypothetical protein
MVKRHLHLQIMFESFQDEYRAISLAACAVLDGENEYRVSVGRLVEGLIFEDECKVTGNSSEQTALCSCARTIPKDRNTVCSCFEEILDLMDIEVVTIPHYVLKRWAWGSTKWSYTGHTAVHRYKSLSSKCLDPAAYRAANFFQSVVR